MPVSTMGFVGLGRIGRLLGSILHDDFEVIGWDVDPPADDVPIRLAELPTVMRSDVVWFCVPASNLRGALTSAVPFLGDDTTVVEVCAVKEHAVRTMGEVLPMGTARLPVHPLFGPDAARSGLRGLRFVLCPVPETPTPVLNHLSDYLARRGFDVAQMTCEEHDRSAASSLCITQLLGRALERMEVGPSRTDTRAFQNLLQLKDVARNDSWQLFRDIQTLNPFAARIRARLLGALKEIEVELSESRPKEGGAREQ